MVTHELLVFVQVRKGGHLKQQNGPCPKRVSFWAWLVELSNRKTFLKQVASRMCPSDMNLDAAAGSYNAFEVFLWGCCAVAVLVRSWGAGRPLRRIGVVFGIAFLLFAVSDLIEIRTGAWWRPWPLLVLKASCVCVLLWCLLAYKRISKH